MDTPDLLSDIRATLMPGLIGTELSPEIAEHLRSGLGGVGIFGASIDSRPQLRALTARIAEANPAAVIAIDEEGGDVTRLFAEVGAPYPGNAVLGRADDLQWTGLVASQVGRSLAEVGVNLTFAPCVDINSDPRNPVIGVRSFGADPELVARHTVAWVSGLRSAGILACPKHFPGHGDTAVDSHLDLPIVDLPVSVLRERELIPFAAAIAAGAETVMSSHIMLPRLDATGPATFSRAILGDLLRTELGFTGVIISDALDMRGASGIHGIGEAAVRALAAGCDLLCLGSATSPETIDDVIAAIAEAVASSRMPASRIADAATRVRSLRAGSRADSSSDGGARDAFTGGVGLGAADDRPQAADVDRVLATFTGIDGAREFLAARPDAPIVQVESEANIAVGASPWGLDAAVRTPLLPAVDTGAPVDVRTVTSASDWPDQGSALVVVARDLHRHPNIRARIEGRLSVGQDVLLVDLGWPSPDGCGPDEAAAGDSAPADRGRLTVLECFGASRLVGAAVLRLIADAVRGACR